MPLLAVTPSPPYVAVIFTSVRASDDPPGYAAAAGAMEQLASEQPGYLGFESAHTASGTGISVSYWQDEDAARAWKLVSDHLAVQRAGQERWYLDYQVRVAVVVRDFGPPS